MAQFSSLKKPSAAWNLECFIGNTIQNSLQESMLLLNSLYEENIIMPCEQWNKWVCPWMIN